MPSVFLRRQKLRTKSRYRALIPKTDAANTPPFLPQSAAPPPNINFRINVATILATWAASVSFSPLFVGGTTPDGFSDPPFGQKNWINQVVAQWEPPPPMPQQRRITVVQSGVAFDQHPTPRAIRIDPSWYEELPPRQARIVNPQGTLVVSSQPVSSESIEVALSPWWQSTDDQPRQRRLGQIVSVDQPPFAQRRVLPALFWDQPIWDAQKRSPQLVLVNDDPPYSQRRNPPALAWDQYWNDAQRRPVTPQVPAAPVNDPPYAQARPPLALLWDYPTWGAQTRSPKLVIVNDDPPYAQRRNPPALLWEQPWWDAQRRPITPQVPAAPVNDPPYAQRRNPPALAWDQYWNDAQRRPVVVVQGARPDQPFSWLPRLRHVLVDGWQEQWYTAAEKRKLAQGAPSQDPPFGQKPWKITLVYHWQPGPPDVLAPRVFREIPPPTSQFDRSSFNRIYLINGEYRIVDVNAEDRIFDPSSQDRKVDI